MSCNANIIGLIGIFKSFLKKLFIQSVVEQKTKQISVILTQHSDM